ncbi:hypothetical protein CCUS01_10996 [Colletotrichum cuscutae]|uniref:Uncharacterized protein n=1 Tax=Colletotrichum cuscutae TaxID=1209917 RepID=A0AAI9U6C3_9PEZI|nr:hypothetical protein CCUS01_10996 [Colletotrichum cuscutae]
MVRFLGHNYGLSAYRLQSSACSGASPATSVSSVVSEVGKEIV